MKKIVFIILFSAVGYLGIAQISLQSMLPQIGIFQKSQLWNMIAINSSEYPEQCYLQLSLQNRQTGAEVLSATSSTFALGKGSKQLNELNLAPIQYTYFSYGGNKTNDFLPVGSYTACFQITGAGHLANDFNEVCIPFDVQPLSPPILTLPTDSAYLIVQPTQFSWQPPAPLTMFQQLNYQLVIAEIFPGQKPEEAVELNAPLYMDLNVPYNFMNYTGAYPSFEKGKWYAWQVVARDGESYADKTAVNTFIIGDKPQDSSNINRDLYILMQDDITGTYPVTKGDIHIKYFSFDKKFSARILFMSEDGTVVNQYKKQIVQGDNYLDFKLDNSFQSGKTYIAIITDLKKNKHVLHFSIQ